MILKQIFRKITNVVLYISVLSILYCFVFVEYYNTIQKESLENTKKVNILNISNSASSDLSFQERKTVNKTRQSVVALFSINYNTKEVSLSSGTYIKIFDRFYVATVRHGIMGDCSVTYIVKEQEMIPCKNIIFAKNNIDFALVEIDEIKNMKAVEIPREIPNKTTWNKRIEIMDTVYYTGFPNSTGPLTIRGYICGLTDGMLLMHSYAWSGASGSGVFSKEGELIGFIIALEVGSSKYGQTPLESVVVVLPLYAIGLSDMLE